MKSKRTKDEVDRGGSVQRADASEVERLVRPIWISCADRMPKEDIDIIIFTPELLGLKVHVGYRSSIRGFGLYTGDGESVETEDVTHWMPIPEPPAA